MAAKTGPESVGAKVGDGGGSYGTVDVPVHDSGFGRGNHPLTPDGRIVSGPGSTLAGETQHTGHIVKGA